MITHLMLLAEGGGIIVDGVTVNRVMAVISSNRQ